MILFLLLNMERLLERISKGLDDYKISVSIVGLGYVGLPLAVKAAMNSNVKVYGIDYDINKVEMLKSNKSYIEDISDDELRSIPKNNIKFTNNYDEAIKKSDITIICVPTPVDVHGTPNLEYIYNSTEEIAKILKEAKKKHIIVLESTTYPTTTEVEIKNKLEAYGLKMHLDFELCFSPERIDPGNKQFGVQNIPKILGATSDTVLNTVKKFYEKIIGTKIVVASSARVAEFTKLFENIFRQVNIALVNELAVLAEKMQIDMFEVIELASTKPFGFLAHYPGPGLGGHCIPVDPYYLSHIAKEYKSSIKFIDISTDVNEKMDEHVLSLVNIALNRVKKSINGTNITIIGYAYKPNVSDMRNSPAIPISNKLRELGGNISICDKLIDQNRIDFPIVEIDDTYKTTDLYLIITPHSYFDFTNIIKAIPLIVPIVDTRGNIANYLYRDVDVALGKPIKEYSINK